jgi:hypothetical protein
MAKGAWRTGRSRQGTLSALCTLEQGNRDCGDVRGPFPALAPGHTATTQPIYWANTTPNITEISVLELPIKGIEPLSYKFPRDRSAAGKDVQ